MPPNRFARYLRKNQTVAEQTLWAELRNRKLDGCKFRRQVALASYIVDFICPDAKLTIELDGIVHKGQEADDLARRIDLEKAGYFEIRFPNEDVAERLHWVIHEIRRALAIAKNRPIPEPLFQMEVKK
jgi:very-short-patch-repair endonuclease